MPTFVPCCTVGEIAPGTGKTVTAGGKELAVFNVEGTFHVIDNECPHRGGPLGEGRGGVEFRLDLAGGRETRGWRSRI